MQDLAGTTAAVTGGASGIRGAVARGQAARGAHVVAGDVSAGSGEVAAREVGGHLTPNHRDSQRSTLRSSARRRRLGQADCSPGMLSGRASRYQANSSSFHAPSSSPDDPNSWSVR